MHVMQDNKQDTGLVGLRCVRDEPTSQSDGQAQEPTWFDLTFLGCAGCRPPGELHCPLDAALSHAAVQDGEQSSCIALQFCGPPAVFNTSQQQQHHHTGSA